MIAQSHLQSIANSPAPDQPPALPTGAEMLIDALVYEGNTAQFGDMTRGPLVINDETKQRMQGLLAEIQSGAFARDWMKEARDGRRRFRQLDDQAREHPIERVGEQLRGMMPWLSQSKLVDKASNLRGFI
jgi:ketol-acid reductoisomerase